MANFGFKPNKMKAMDNKYMNVAGNVAGLGAGTLIPNGALVYSTNTVPVSIYGTPDFNLEGFAQYTAATKGRPYVLDAAEVPEVTDINGNTYKVGGILSNLQFRNTAVLRYRELSINDRGFFFDGNITGNAPTVGQFLTPTANSFLYTVSANQPATGLAIVVMAIMPLNNGLRNVGNQYFCKVVQL